MAQENRDVLEDGAFLGLARLDLSAPGAEMSGRSGRTIAGIHSGGHIESSWATLGFAWFDMEEDGHEDALRLRC